MGGVGGAKALQLRKRRRSAGGCRAGRSTLEQEMKRRQCAGSGFLAMSGTRAAAQALPVK